VIPSSVTSLGDSAFEGLSIASINIPTSVTSIGMRCFFYCSNLNDIKINASVTSIGNGAFRYCNSLKWVKCLGTTPATIGNYVFDNANNCPIYVPYAALSTYKGAANWSAYQARIMVEAVSFITYTTSDSSILNVNPTSFG